MIGPDRLDRIAAQAVVPEQIVCYVKAVSGGNPRLFGSCLGYEFEDSLVLIGYPLHDPRDEQALHDSLDAWLWPPARPGGLRYWPPLPSPGHDRRQ
jgi:hypothetical protein